MVGGDKICLDAAGGTVDDAVEAVIAAHVVHAGVAVTTAENRLHGRGCVYEVIVVVWVGLLWLGGNAGGGIGGRWSC